MSSPRLDRFFLVATLALGAVMLAGCASSSAPSSTIAPTSSAPASTTPPTSTTPPASPAPAPTVDEYGEFSASGLIEICVGATKSAFASDVQFDTANSRIEHRNVDPEWLVLVPAQTSGVVGEAQCTIGGSPTSPDIGLSSASIERLPEEQIQKLIDGKNEGGDR